MVLSKCDLFWLTLISSSIQFPMSAMMSYCGPWFHIFMTEIFHCTHTPHFIYLPGDAWLHFLVTVHRQYSRKHWPANTSAGNWLGIKSLTELLMSIMVGSRGIFRLWGLFILTSLLAAQVYAPTTAYNGFLRPISLLAFVILVCLRRTIMMQFHSSFNLSFPED